MYNKRFLWFLTGLFFLVFLTNQIPAMTAGNKIPILVLRVNTADEETERILYTFRNIGFFEENKYNVSLPNHPFILDLKYKALIHKLTIEDKAQLATLMKNEIYTLKQYEPGLAKLTNTKGKVLKCFNVFLDYQKRWGFKVFQQYQINLTLYGVGGSYSWKNGIVTLKIRENGEFKKDPAETIVHEMVHMGIEEGIIQKYHLPHWTKERIVDQFMVSHYQADFPNYKLDARGNPTIDPYLQHPDSWQRLPDYIAKYVQSLQ